MFLKHLSNLTFLLYLPLLSICRHIRFPLISISFLFECRCAYTRVVSLLVVSFIRFIFAFVEYFLILALKKSSHILFSFKIARTCVRLSILFLTLIYQKSINRKLLYSLLVIIYRLRFDPLFTITVFYIYVFFKFPISYL